MNILTSQPNLNGYEISQEIDGEQKIVAYIIGISQRALKRLLRASNDFIEEELQKGAVKVVVNNPETNKGMSSDYGMLSIGCFDEFGDLSGGIAYIAKDFENL